MTFLWIILFLYIFGFLGAAPELKRVRKGLSPLVKKIRKNQVVHEIGKRAARAWKALVGSDEMMDA
jgi:hypothetical protein